MERVRSASCDPSLRLQGLTKDSAAEAMQLILNKITTPITLPRISRTRLLNLLQNSLDSYTATLLNGRTGTGKTMLATDFAEHCGRSVSWYKVDASDAAPRIFLRSLIESIRRIRANFGAQDLLNMVETATLEEMPHLAEAFVYELVEGGDGNALLIVIDDLHLVYDAEWLSPFFRRLLPLLPAEAHLLIAGRSLPPAPLWRMRSKQTLHVIDEPTLAFTQAEANLLFESYGLSEAHAAVALEHTRGRAATLDKFASMLSMAGRAVAENFITTDRRSQPLTRV